MSLFRNSKSEAHDPVFGRVVLDEHGWSSEVSSPSGRGVVDARVARVDMPPTEEDRKTYSALLISYPSQVAQIKEALHRLWAPELETGSWDGSAPTTTDDLWNMLQLEGLTVRHNEVIDLHFAFVGEFWPDASFTIQVAQGLIRPRSLDD